MKRRDPRTFRPFVKLAADGSIAAVVHVADGSPAPVDGAGSIFVDVSAFGTRHPAPSGAIIRGGNVDLETDARVQKAITTAIAATKVVKPAPDFTPVITPVGPGGIALIGPTRG